MQKAAVGFYGALSDARSAISPVRPSLEYTMPVLSSIQYSSKLKSFDDTDHARGSIHGRVIQLVHHVNFEVITLGKQQELRLGDRGMT